MNEGELEHTATVANLATVQNEGELVRASVVAFFATTAADGKSYQVEYNTISPLFKHNCKTHIEQLN